MTYKSKREPWIASQLVTETRATGPHGYGVMRKLPPQQLYEKIAELLKKKKGDGSIAVALNRQGIECDRATVYFVRTGSILPRHEGYEEVSLAVSGDR